MELEGGKSSGIHKQINCEIQRAIKRDMYQRIFEELKKKFKTRLGEYYSVFRRFSLFSAS